MEIKTLPFDNNLEAGILAGIIFKVNNVDRAYDYLSMLEVELFINSTHKAIFKELKASVCNDKTIGIPKTLSTLETPVMTSFIELGIMEFHLEKSIEDLKEVKLRREIIIKSKELEDLSYNNDIHKNELIENFNIAANEISGLRSTEMPTTINVIKNAISRVQEAVNGNSNEQIKYCHPEIDDKIMLFRKQIHSLGAGQGGGKTALALDCMKRQINAGMNIVYFCTESSSDELLLRMIGSEIKTDMQSILTGKITPHIMNEFKFSIAKFKEKHNNFWIIGLGDWDCTVSGANSLLSKIMREAGNIDMAYWDFLQDIQSYSKGNTDIIETIRLATAGIKTVTERHNFASTVLSQFRKDKTNHRPGKHDFWGASSIINASHVMSCLYSESKEDNHEPDEIREVWWYSVKTRLIKDWSKPLMFNGAHGTFYGAGQETRYSQSDRPSTHNKGAGR